MMAVTAITMTITPLLLMLNERIIDPRFGVKEISEETTRTTKLKKKILLLLPDLDILEVL